MTSTEECSSMNLSHVSFVRKCTLPGSLLQSGGGGGGAGFWGLEHSMSLGVRITLQLKKLFKYSVMHNLFWLLFLGPPGNAEQNVERKTIFNSFQELFQPLLLTLS